MPLPTLHKRESILGKQFSFSTKKVATTLLKNNDVNADVSSSEEDDDHLPADEKKLYQDMKQVRKALDYFLDSNINEAEALLKPHYKDSMYFSLGYSFILYLKCVMTFEKDDINHALEILKHTIHISASQRRKDTGWLDSITNWVKGTTLDDLKQMTVVQRHAELVYSEAYLLKALLCIIHDESVMSFLRESLHIRSSYNTYIVLEKYLNFVNEIKSKNKDVSKYEMDDNFTSGVSLGVGCFSLILSMLPASVIKVAEFIGFSSDRAHGLHVLESVGGWRNDDEKHNDGLRRELCDMILITYHVVLSRIAPLSDIDEGLAAKILAFDLNRFPKGVFFLYLNGRLMVSRRLLEEAKQQYQLAIDTQKDWKQLQHMCFWELGTISTVQKRWSDGFDIYDELGKESNWSKAVYTYLKAVSLYVMTNEMVDGEDKTKKMEQVKKLMEQVNGQKKKIAGKTIPMEKFMSRKARKFLNQGNYLILPDLEILNAFSGFEFMPVDVLKDNKLRIQKELDRLTKTPPKEIANYYDDLCFVHYLQAVVCRMLYIQGYEMDKMKELHTKSLDVVFKHGKDLTLDHYVYFFSRYENARMLLLCKEYAKAETEINVVLKADDRGQYNIGSGSAKGKYSLASPLTFKCHNCMTKIKAELKAETESK